MVTVLEKQQLKVGDKVSWNAQKNGSSNSESPIKQGLIVRCIEANMTIEQCWRTHSELLDMYCMNNLQKSSFSSTRNHDSYLVEVLSDNHNKKPSLYWPRVKALTQQE